MKAYLVYVEYEDGSIEGVVFSDYEDAVIAQSGEQCSGSTLAYEWCGIIEDSGGLDLEIKMKEIEI